MPTPLGDASLLHGLCGVALHAIGFHEQPRDVVELRERD
jgi:hypothetical protein